MKFFILFVISAIFVLINSLPLSPWYTVNAGGEIDQNIFQYMGYAITCGKIPYTDYFDHKGLILYFFNAVGIIINKRWGILLLQIINLALVLIILYKGLVNIKSSTSKILILVVSLFGLYHCYQGGNLTEDWSLLFICYPMVLYFTKVKVGGIEKFTNLELLSIGLCIGCIMMIRLNNFAPILGILIYCAFLAIKEKEYSYLFKSFGFILIGILFPIVLCIIYMYVKGGYSSLEDMFLGNLAFNLEYKEKMYQNPYDVSWLKYAYKMLLPIPFIIFTCAKKPLCGCPLLLAYVFALLTMGRAHFWHYLIILFPLMVLSIGVVERRWRFVLIAVIIITNVKTWYSCFSLSRYQKSDSVEMIEKLLTDIPQSERDKVWAHNCEYLLRAFIQNDLLQCNRIFQNDRLPISKELTEKETNKICKVRPEYIIYPIYKESWKSDAIQYPGIEKDIKFVRENYEMNDSVIFNDETKVYLLKIVK